MSGHKFFKLVSGLLVKTTGFTLVELMVVMMLTSTFLFGLTQYTLTGWKLVWGEKSVLAMLGEARTFHDILAFGGTNVSSLRGELSRGAQAQSVAASGIYAFTKQENIFTGDNYVGVSSASYTFYDIGTEAGEDTIDFGANRFCENTTDHLIQYDDDTTCVASPQYTSFFSPYVDTDGNRHGYLRGITAATGGGDNDMVRVDLTLDDFQNVKRLFQTTDPRLATSPKYFRQKFRVVGFGH